MSALTGSGIENLLDRIELRLAHNSTALAVTLDPSDGRGLNWLYESTEILSRQDDGEGFIHLTVRVPPERLQRVQNRFPQAAPMAVLPCAIE